MIMTTASGGEFFFYVAAVLTSRRLGSAKTAIWSLSSVELCIVLAVDPTISCFDRQFHVFNGNFAVHTSTSTKKIKIPD